MTTSENIGAPTTTEGTVTDQYHGPTPSTGDQLPRAAGAYSPPAADGYFPPAAGGYLPPPTGGYLPPPAPRPTAKRGTAAVVIGAVLLGSGFLTAASGGALLALFGDGQVLSSGQHVVATSTSAMVTDLGRIDGINGLDFVTGAPTLHISAESVGDTAVFVGVGPTDEVERYLDDVATETVTNFDLSPFSIDTARNDGSAVAQAPTEQDFWTASSASSDVASVAWQIENGSYEIVVMNADGSADVLTAVEIGASLPSSGGLWILVLSIGVLIMIGGGALLFAGVRQGRVTLTR